MARDGVLERLKAIVRAEDKAHPHSDERLSELLKAEGFAVARRTVAKYRKLAGIPGAAHGNRPCELTVVFALGL